MKCFFSFQIIFLILIFAASALAKDVWFEINTPNFQIAGNIEEREIRETAKKLEQFHETFQSSFNKIRFKTPYPSKVIVFKNASVFC